jgi:hypothetical protein
MDKLKLHRLPSVNLPILIVTLKTLLTSRNRPWSAELETGELQNQGALIGNGPLT